MQANMNARPNYDPEEETKDSNVYQPEYRMDVFGLLWIDDIEEGTAGSKRIQVIFSLDKIGILTVSAKDAATGHVLSTRELGTVNHLTDVRLDELAN